MCRNSLRSIWRTTAPVNVGHNRRNSGGFTIGRFRLQHGASGLRGVRALTQYFFHFFSFPYWSLFPRALNVPCDGSIYRIFSYHTHFTHFSGTTFSFGTWVCSTYQESSSWSLTCTKLLYVIVTGPLDCSAAKLCTPSTISPSICLCVCFFLLPSIVTGGNSGQHEVREWPIFIRIRGLADWFFGRQKIYDPVVNLTKKIMTPWLVTLKKNLYPIRLTPFPDK